MITLFKRNRINYPDGVLERPDYSPDKHNFERPELVSGATPIHWKEKKPSEFKHYWNGQYDQYTSGSCYAWSLSLLMEQEENQEEHKRIKFSARQAYALAGEKPPIRGMRVEKGMRWLKNNGMTLDYLLPSNHRTELGMKDLSDYKIGDREVGLVYKPSGFVYLTSFDFDEIAQVLEEGHFLSVSVRLSYNGWGNDRNGFVREPKAGEGIHYHATTITDYGLINGRKYISFEQAWGKWGYNHLGYGFYSENYKPFMFVMPQYLINLPNNWRDTEEYLTDKPHYKWERDLWRGMTGAKQDIIALQDALKYEGCFPYQQKSTGWFGGITFGAVEKFQTKYADKILKPLGLTKATGFVGPSTRKVLNQLFS